MHVHPQNFRFGENPGKITEHLGKICGKWAKCVNAFGKSLYVLWFYKNGTKIEVQMSFFWKSNLDKNGAWSALVYFEVIFFGGVFEQVWENLSKNPSHPQKSSCPYTYAYASMDPAYFVKFY